MFADQLEQLVAARTDELVHSQTRLRALATELNLAEQRERKRVATELHDHLAQLMVLGRLTLSQAKRLAGVPSACAELIARTEEVLTESLAYTRTLVADLAPPVLHDLGLPTALKWLGERMERHQLAVTVEVRTEENLLLPEDRAVLLFQSVRELLMNASKHAGSAEASVTLERRNGDLRITVKDCGKGFDPVAAAAMSDDDESTTRALKFGLFSIRERMKALGGSFTIDSMPGKGTTAILSLPLTRNAESAALSLPPADLTLNIQNPAFRTLELFSEPSHQPAPAHHKNGTTTRVLLVDDHAMVRQGLRSVLEAYADIEVVGEAWDGHEAVAFVERLRPAIVVMDINMPKMNGVEATAIIKKRYPDAMVIGLSVQTTEETREAMLKAGAAVLLSKEAAVDTLYGAIQQALGGNEMVRAQKC
jgi:CheY-like chemotaxis protein/two-component sensor histidine kinase